MGNITTWNGGTPSKTTLGSYVHDAKEMEFSLYTLQLMREMLKEKIAEMKLKRNYPSKSIPYPCMENELKATKKPSISYRIPTKEEEEAAVKKYRSEHQDEYCGSKGFGIREYMINAKNKKSFREDITSVKEAEVIRRYHQEIESYNEEAKRKNEEEEIRYKEACERAEMQNLRIRERNANRKKEYENKCKSKDAPHSRKIAIMQAQLKNLESAIIYMTQQREQFYGVNLIPVDYRTLDCVFMLDQIFRNDLADTMREAIAKYEERVFRGEVIQGISAIISRIDTLTGLMGDLGRQLGSIQTQVSFLSNDLYNIAERQSKAQDQQNQFMEETRLQRYTTEELNRNAEKIVKYCDTGRTY